jgi:hypothetical protein
MSKESAGNEITKHQISTTIMSTCCEILEIISECERSEKKFSNFEEGILSEYNEKKRKHEAESFSPVKIDHISSQIQLLKKLEFVDKDVLSSQGKRIASHCANGEYDSIVSFYFFKNLYKHSIVFRKVVEKIRSNDFELNEIIHDFSKKEGLNKTASGRLKAWINWLNFTTTSRNKISFDPIFEDQALQLLTIDELGLFIESIISISDSIKENNLYSEIDAGFSNGTLSIEQIQALIRKLIEEKFLILSRGKFETNYISINNPLKFEKITLKKYFSD